MLKFVLGLSIWAFAVSGYLYLYEAQPQVAIIIGLALFVLFVGFTAERGKK